MNDYGGVEKTGEEAKKNRKMPRQKSLSFIIVVFTLKKRSFVIEHYLIIFFICFSMYLYPWKLLSKKNRRSNQEHITQNERYKKLLPFIRRYTFNSRRIEQSIRKENNDIQESSFQGLQVHKIVIFFLFYG